MDVRNKKLWELLIDKDLRNEEIFYQFDASLDGVGKYNPRLCRESY